MNFAIQVHDWFVRVVWVGINQSQARIVKDIINSENCYVIYLLHIIDILNYFTLKHCKHKKHIQIYFFATFFN